MTKKKYLTIIWSITLIIVVVAIIAHLTGFIGFSFGWGKSVSGEEGFGNKDIEELVVDCDIADLDIEYGNEVKVEYNCPKKFLPKIKYESGKLSVTQHKDKEIFNLGFHSNDDYKIIVTIPDDTVVKTMDITLDVGDLDIDEVNCGDIKIRANVGDVSIQKMEANSTDFNLDVGDFNIKNSDIKKLNITCDIGDIDIEGDYEEIDAKAEVGDIDIELDGEVDRNKIKAKCDLGDVTVNGVDW